MNCDVEQIIKKLLTNSWPTESLSWLCKEPLLCGAWYQCHHLPNLCEPKVSFIWKSKRLMSKKTLLTP